MEENRQSLKVIGRTELVDIPEWDLFELVAKIDTGAYTSSLHCHHIKPLEKKGKSFVRFKLLDPSHAIYNDKEFELPIYKTKKVKSSNGQIEERFIVETTIIVVGERLKAQFSLTDRSEMRYPILIGRRLLKGRFLVDVQRKTP